MDQSPNALKPFMCHGVEFESSNSSQAIGECFLCQKAKHLYVNKKTGQWDCKSCGESGNVITFLTKYSEDIHDLTTLEEFKNLERLRGLPASVFEDWHLGFDGSQWLLPVASETGTVRDIRRWDPKKKIMRSTTGCKSQLYGTIKAARLPADGTIWICEGEWDTMVAARMLRLAKCENAAAVGVPGADIFKGEWVPLFRNKNVVLCYDNDSAGQRGIIKAYEHLYPVASSIQVLVWTEQFKKGFDLRDFYCSRRKKKLKSRQILKRLSKYIQPIDDYIDNLPEEIYPERSPAPVLTPLSNVQPQKVRWTWPNRIPEGKLSILAGNPGLGKSFLTLDTAARVSKGDPWPDSDVPNPIGSVVLLSAEDGLADTIRPRLDAAGADVSKIVALEGIVVRKGSYAREFDLTKDLAALEQAIRRMPDTRLVIIDPITAYMGSTDSHKNAEVRRVLAPLARIAERHHVAVIAVSHLNKNDAQQAIHRTMGSLAFVAAARAVWLVIRHKDQKDKRRLVPCKANLSINPTGLAFEIVDGVVEFDAEPFEVDSPDDFTSDKSAMDRAVDMLQDLLKDGRVAATKVFGLAKKRQISVSTLKRAKTRLGITAMKKGSTKFGAWYWQLPGGSR